MPKAAPPPLPQTVEQCTQYLIDGQRRIDEAQRIYNEAADEFARIFRLQQTLAGASSDYIADIQAQLHNADAASLAMMSVYAGTSAALAWRN